MTLASCQSLSCILHSTDCTILYYFRIAQRRDASVTKEVSMELDSNKKLTRQEKDERLGWWWFLFSRYLWVQWRNRTLCLEDKHNTYLHKDVMVTPVDNNVTVFSFFVVACVAWRFCRVGCRSGVAAKFAREARENERRSREKNKNRLPGFVAFSTAAPFSSFWHPVDNLFGFSFPSQSEIKCWQPKHDTKARDIV